MKYRIILSLALIAILAFAVIVSLDSGSAHNAITPDAAAPAANPTNFNL